MLKNIAAVAGLRFNDKDTLVMGLLNRIANYIPEGVTPEDVYFANVVKIAEDRVNAEGNLAIVSLVKAITAEPVEKVLKIKSSP